MLRYCTRAVRGTRAIARGESRLHLVGVARFGSGLAVNAQHRDPSPPPPRKDTTLTLGDDAAPRRVEAHTFPKTSTLSNKDAATTAPRNAVDSSNSIAKATSPTTPTIPKSKTKFNFKPLKVAVTLTPTAIEKLAQLQQGPNKKYIRIGTKSKGCAGMVYHLEYVDGKGKFDEQVEQDGVAVLVDNKALFSIIGSEMDWVEDRLSSRFVFKNPNVKESCGCGESFNVG